MEYQCYRFSIIDEKLWCIEKESPRINNYDGDGNKTCTISFNQIGICQAVAQVKEGILVATTTGLYHTDVEGKGQNCILDGNICDVTIRDNTVYTLDNADAKVHILHIHAQNTFKFHSQFTVVNLTEHWLNSIVVTSGYVYVGQFSGHTIYAADGTLQQKLGSGGSGCGMLRYPFVCGADANGCVLIVDHINHRLQTVQNGSWRVMNLNGLNRPVWTAFNKYTLYITEELTNKLKIFSFQ